MLKKDVKLTREELLAAYAAGDRDFSGANLFRANLSLANLFRAYLNSANLSGADLSGAYLNSAYLTSANLTGADLSGANLSGADLTGADLSGADLTGAYLINADLTGADLTGAYLTGAYLTGAYLSGAIGFRFTDAPDPAELRIKVAEMIESSSTSCSVAGWACRLGGGTRGKSVSSAATRLLWLDGKPMPSFSSSSTREEILATLRA